MNSRPGRNARLFLMNTNTYAVCGTVVAFDAHGYHVESGTHRYTVPMHNVAYVQWGEADDEAE